MAKKLSIENLEMNKSREAELKMVYWFFAYPELKITLSDLSSELGIAKATANRIVKKLVKNDFLILEKIGKAWRICSNKSHPLNRTLKISYNLSLVYSVDLISKIYLKIGHPKAIILFGSYRKGDDNEKSDLDIAVEVAGNQEHKVIHLEDLKEFGYRRNVPVQVHVFSRSKVDINLFANIANGIVLDGFLEVKP